MASRGCLCWGLAIFSNPPRAGGLTYHTQVGVAPSRPEMGVFQLQQGGVSPLGNSSAGGDEYVHVAGIPSENALVRGAEGQRRMESPWCSHPCSYCGFSCSSCRRWVHGPYPPACSPQYRRASQFAYTGGHGPCLRLSLINSPMRETIAWPWLMHYSP